MNYQGYTPQQNSLLSYFCCISVATMNYQDYAALQNSLTSYLQSSADNEDVTLPSNLTMENINAAIQSEGSLRA